LTYTNIAIIRLSSLGDIIHTLPAMGRLREAFPQARITWIAEPAGARLLKNFSGIDEIAVIDLKTPGITRRIKTLKEFLHRYRRQFDLVLDFQGLLKSAILAHLLKGHSRGFHPKNLKERPAKIFYTEVADYLEENGHVVFKNLHLVEKLIAPGGAPADRTPLPYSLKPLAASQSLNAFLSSHHLEHKQFIIVNVGGGWPTKTLKNHQVIEIIKRLKEPPPIVLLWGNDKERQSAQSIAGQTAAIPAIYLDFPDLILLIRYARLLVTADTLALHLADMVDTPSIGLFGPTSPRRNGSLLEKSTAIYPGLDCCFCYKKKCDTIDCMEKIDIAQIVASIEKTNEKPG